MRISAGLHQLADTLYHPVAADADRPTGPRSRLPDERLYAKEASRFNGGRGNENTAKKSTATRSTAKSTTRGKGN